MFVENLVASVGLEGEVYPTQIQIGLPPVLGWLERCVGAMDGVDHASYGFYVPTWTI